jgi:hypothetical protein
MHGVAKSDVTERDRGEESTASVIAPVPEQGRAARIEQA